MNGVSRATRALLWSALAIGLALGSGRANAQVEGFSLDEMLGKGSSLNAGRLELERNVKTGEIVSLKVTTAVRIRSEKMDLDCEYLIHDPKENRLIATGEPNKPVFFKNPAYEMVCQRLVMDTLADGQKFVLEGNPVIRDKSGAKGAPMETRGEKITVVMTGDVMRVLVDSVALGDKAATSQAPAEIVVPDVEAARESQKAQEAKPAEEKPKEAERLNGADKKRPPVFSE